MKRFSVVLSCVLVAGMLSGCGGGGGNDSENNDKLQSSVGKTETSHGDGTSGGSGGSGASGGSPGPDSSAPDTTTEPTTFSAVKPRQGDTFTYQINGWDTGTGTPFSSLLTQYFFDARPDGSVNETFVLEEPSSSGITVELDATGAATKRTIHAGQTCTFTPAFAGEMGPLPGFERIAGSYGVGTSWNNTATGYCEQRGLSSAITLTNIGSVVGVENVTVNGMAFKAAKEVYAVAGNGSKFDYTCWRDTALGRAVKCNVSLTYMPPDAAPAVQYTATISLMSYTANGKKGSAAVTPPTSVFAGGWDFTFSGTGDASCFRIVIASDGNVTGTCKDSTGTDYSVKGNVDADGKIAIGEVQTGAILLTGQLTSPMSGHGTWSTNAGGSGTWKATHR